MRCRNEVFNNEVPSFFWRGGSLSVLHGQEYRPHWRPRCLLTEILNEMGSKRNVKTEVPFFCGSSLACL
jgi:hypothetical protein